MRARSLWLAGLALALGASAAHAQIPIQDNTTIAPTIARALQYVVQAAVVSGKWRDQMMDKVKKLENRTKELIHQRELLEARAYGDLGGIGKGLPDWNGLIQNACGEFLAPGSVKPDSVTLKKCDITDRADRTFREIPVLSIERVQKAIFADSLSPDKVEVALMGSGMTGRSARLASDSTSTFSQLRPFVLSQARFAVHLDSASEKTNTFIDSLIVKEKLRDNVSSGRADQVTVRVALMELELRTDLLSQRVNQLRMETIHALDDARSAHATSYTTHHALKY